VGRRLDPAGVCWYRMGTLTAGDRKRASVLGAIVADAASLGLHWIYSQPAIHRIAPDAPEFVEPTQANYEGISAYFAHTGRHAGDSSMHGAGILLLLRSLASCGGTFSEGTYLSSFREFFGPGGNYVGYVERPIKETLYNADSMVRRARTLVWEAVLNLAEDLQRKAAYLVGNHFLEHDAEALSDMVVKRLGEDRLTEAGITELSRVMGTLREVRAPTGADDTQMPALTPIAPLVAAYAGDRQLEEIVERAVRITNNNDLAVAYALGLARLLEQIIVASDQLGAPDPDTSVDQSALVQLMKKSFRQLPEPNRLDVEAALSLLQQESEAITTRYRPACDCAMGVPSALHMATTATGYVEAVRTNIYASGDSCGRAMIVGPLMGALHGVGGRLGIRHDWIGRTAAAAEANALLAQLTESGG
jgi:ADP-ribosylglycohydrolase